MDEKNDFEMENDDLQDDVLDDQPELNETSQDFVEEDFVLDEDTDDDIPEEDESDFDVQENDEEEFVFTPSPVSLPMTDDLDIDAALASVADLGDVLAEREAAEIAERERIDKERRAAEEEEKRRAEHYFPRPPLLEIERGQMISVIPALVLIALGAWWTFALSTATTAPTSGQMALVIMAAFGVIAVAYWLFSGRWSSGSLFAGATALIAAGLIVFLNGGTLDGGYPLLLLAPAIAMGVVAVFSARTGRQTGFTSVLLIVVAVAGYLVTSNQLSGDGLTDLARILLPIFGGILVVILALPLIFRRQA